MVEVEVRDFQSIDRASFQIDGFTVVVGRSNIGKSALVRAVKAALTGASAASFVRHGPACLRRTKQAKTCKCQTSVHIRAEGFDLLWEKGDSINRYTFNGAIYDKAERGTPAFLNPQFSPVQVGTGQQLLQVADQFSPIFLLDQSGGVVADVLSDVARLDRISSAIRLAEKDRKEKVATRKVREKDVQVLGARLQSYAGLDDVLAELKALDTKKLALTAREKSLQDIDQFSADLSSVALAIRELTRLVNLAVPQTSTLDVKHSTLKTLSAFQEDFTTKSAAIKALSGVDEVCVPSPLDCVSLADRLKLLCGWVDKAVEIKGWLAPWKSVDECCVPDNQKLKATYAVSTRASEFYVKYTNLVADIDTLEKSLSETIQQGKELDEEQRELGVCPTCIRPISECQE